MALCSGDSESFIYKEEAEIKSFHPRALVYFIVRLSAYRQLSSSCQTSTLHQRERDRKKKATDVYISHPLSSPFKSNTKIYSFSANSIFP